MKRILAIVLVGVMALSFAACGKKCDYCGKTKGDVKSIMGLNICSECEQGANDALGDLEDALGDLGDALGE